MVAKNGGSLGSRTWRSDEEDERNGFLYQSIAQIKHTTDGDICFYCRITAGRILCQNKPVVKLIITVGSEEDVAVGTVAISTTRSYNK